MLVQQSAMVALLSAAPNPLAATAAFAVPLLPVALAVGVINFIVLPGVFGLVPFTLAVGPLMFVAASMARHARLGRYAGSATLCVALLPGPSNQQSFDFSTCCNAVVQLVLAATFTFLSFDLVLRDSPKRHVRRLARAIATELGHTLRDRSRTLDLAPRSRCCSTACRAASSGWDGSRRRGAD